MKRFAERTLLWLGGSGFFALLWLLGLLWLIAFVLFLAELGGELVAAFVALAAEAEAAAGGAFGGGVFFEEELEEHHVAAVADAVLGELDDAGVAAVASGELGGDVVEELLDNALAGELLLVI